MPPGLHWYDLVILATVALLFFAPKRLPQLGSSLGKTIKDFRKSMKAEAPSQTPDASLPPASPPKAAQPTAATQPTAAEATSPESQRD